MESRRPGVQSRVRLRTRGMGRHKILKNLFQMAKERERKKRKNPKKPQLIKKICWSGNPIQRGANAQSVVGAQGGKLLK